jgi:surfeit locus 1 family protein
MTAARGDRDRSRLLALLVWPAIAVLIGLGTWQTQRLDWKAELIESIETRQNAPAIALPTGLTAAEVEAREFTNIQVTGRFRHADEMIVLARSREGRAGSRVVTPLETDDGRVVLIDRGWVPVGAEDPAMRAEGQVAGMVALDGLLRAPGRTNLFTPDNQPDENVWYWIDPEAMATRAGITAQPFYIEAGPAANSGGLPVGGRPVLAIANNHLQYAITWYGLAAGLLAVYVVFRRAERRRPT